MWYKIEYHFMADCLTWNFIFKKVLMADIDISFHRYKNFHQTILLVDTILQQEYIFHS